MINGFGYRFEGRARVRRREEGGSCDAFGLVCSLHELTWRWRRGMLRALDACGLVGGDRDWRRYRCLCQ